MKGVVLAGGKGVRLKPLTTITNKHLLGVFDRPMVMYPLETLKALGITEVLVISSADRIGNFAELLGDGEGVGMDITYRVQAEASGIADALRVAKNFVNGEKFSLILGDNIFENDRLPFADIKAWEANGDSALILLKRVSEPHRFGVPKIKDGKIVKIIEKPKDPPSDFAVTGLYFYPADAFAVLPTLTPSARGELEITDLNNFYIERGRIAYAAMLGFWVDAGTTESLMAASLWAAERSGVTAKTIEAAAAKRETLTLTIGIPTYYGGPSLVRAAESIMASEGVQKFRFIVNVDGNPLKPEIESRLVELGVEVIFSAQRGGQVARLNHMKEIATTDLLVFAQDDIVFERDTLRKLVAAFDSDPHLTMANANVMPAPAEIFFERVEQIGQSVVKRIVRQWRSGDNYLAANGRCQVFRTSWVKQFHLPEVIVNSDAYKYFENKLRGGKFKFVEDAVVFDRSPLTLQEYVRQTQKYQSSSRELGRYFPSDITGEYRVPLGMKIRAYAAELIRHPILAPFYLPLFIYSRLVPPDQTLSRFWETDVSTKR